MLSVSVFLAIVFIFGMILESLPVAIILAPILAPVAQSVGVDPIHFSVIFLVGASIGFITPPYGLNLYVASGVTGVPYFRLLRYAVSYLVALITVWIVVALCRTCRACSCPTEARERMTAQWDAVSSQSLPDVQQMDRRARTDPRKRRQRCK